MFTGLHNLALFWAEKLQSKTSYYILQASLLVLWSESLTANHEVPGSIPGSTVGIFLEGEDSRGDHGLGRLVEFRFKAPPGTTTSSITTHTSSGQRNCASWASQPQVGYTPAMPRREDHEVHKGQVVALEKKIFYSPTLILSSHLRLSSRWSLFFRSTDHNPECIFLLPHSRHKRRQLPPPPPTEMMKLSIEGKKFFFFILIHVVEQTWPSIMLSSS